jgi:hypothetical protein
MKARFGYSLNLVRRGKRTPNTHILTARRLSRCARVAALFALHSAVYLTGNKTAFPKRACLSFTVSRDFTNRDFARVACQCGTGALAGENEDPTAGRANILNEEQT